MIPEAKYRFRDVKPGEYINIRDGMADKVRRCLIVSVNHYHHQTELRQYPLEVTDITFLYDGVLYRFKDLTGRKQVFDNEWHELLINCDRVKQGMRGD